MSLMGAEPFCGQMFACILNTNKKYSSPIEWPSIFSLKNYNKKDFECCMQEYCVYCKWTYSTSSQNGDRIVTICR